VRFSNYFVAVSCYTLAGGGRITNTLLDGIKDKDVPSLVEKCSFHL